MTTTTALVPFQGFLPSRAGLDDFWASLDHRRRNRRQEEAVLRVFKPDGIEGIYGSDGKRVSKLRTGGIVDIYV